MAAHSSILAWRIPWTGKPGGLWLMWSQRVRYNWSDLAWIHTYIFYKITLRLINNFISLLWQPTPVFFPGKSHGRRSLVGYSPWGGKESDTTEWLHFLSEISCPCHNWRNGHELGQTLGNRNREEQGGLACCSLWAAAKEAWHAAKSDTTGRVSIHRQINE